MREVLATIETALLPLLEKRDMLLVPSLAGDRLRLIIRSRESPFTLHEIWIKPKLFEREPDAKYETGVFYIGESPDKPKSAALGKLADLVRALLLKQEKGLDETRVAAYFGQEPRAYRNTRPAVPGCTEDVLEACGIAGDAPQYILRISYACSQKCPFCFVPLTGRRVQTGNIEKALDYICGISDPAKTTLTISGGEPAGDPRLPALLALARTKGFGDFLLQTNAVYLSKASLVGQLAAAGLRRYFISFHASVPEVYDRITASRGQFELALAGIRNVMADDRNEIMLNTVINRLNFRLLPAHADFISKLCLPFKRPADLNFALVNTQGPADEQDFSIDLPSVAPYLNEAISRCRRQGIPLAKFTGDCAPPFCVLEDPASLVEPGTISDYGVLYHDESRGRINPSGPFTRAKKMSCRTCVFDSHCRGVSREHALRYGVDALRPIERA